MSDLLQQDIFGEQHHSPQFAELCNALYERELSFLSQSTEPPSRIQRRLSSLSYYVKKAAYELLQPSIPLTIDVHNASWQEKQSSRCPARAIIAKQTCITDETDEAQRTYQRWFERHAVPGMVAFVYYQQLGIEHIEIDAIDRVDKAAARVHVNRGGWFHFNGQPQTSTDSAASTLDQTSFAFLCKPSKPIAIAAACGHRWNHKGKVTPRALTLRELLIATQINWKGFK